MTRRYTTIAICLLWPVCIPYAQASELNIYAGPQSVAPREIIHVTVQSLAQKTDIELSYTMDDGPVIRTATTKHGMVSFEIPAQNTVGQMRFMAKMGEDVSNTAIVSVFAGPPQNFALNIKSGKQLGTVYISSDIIKDAFENPISDLALVSIDWSDEKGLRSSQYIQLTQGRISLNTKCPNQYDGVLTLRAEVNSAVSNPINVSSFCRDEN